MFQARQGDVFFTQVDGPKGTQKKISPILAYGEVTGHMHKIIDPSMDELDSYVDENGDIFVKNSKGPIIIAHDEHGSVTLPQDQWFSITRQREYDSVAAMKERQVKD
jgi:hypothetical protein